MAYYLFPVLTASHLTYSRWTKQNILLDNPTDETLELMPHLSNTNNFSLEHDTDRPIILAPNSSKEIPLHFMPSMLGEGDHLAKITFVCEQVIVHTYMYMDSCLCQLYMYLQSYNICHQNRIGIGLQMLGTLLGGRTVYCKLSKLWKEIPYKKNTRE